MKKPIAISEWQISLAKIADVFLKKTEGATLPSRFQVFQPTGTEIIDPKNFMPICKEGIHKVTTNEARGSCDDTTHNIKNSEETWLL
jgi:hypothetical protein